jgi:hypothetical protein
LRYRLKGAANTRRSPVDRCAAGVEKRHRALDELRVALTEAAIRHWQAPESLRDLEELEAELAPARSLEVVRRFLAPVAR